jgi:hypothetical protein
LILMLGLFNEMTLEFNEIEESYCENYHDGDSDDPSNKNR